jgi:exonuclease SbcC
MIESITLENWKTHKKSTLQFGKGTNVLVGVIGSGKTSVTDALCYALFGSFPSIQSRRINTADVLMRKPLKADVSRVQVIFSRKKVSYKVERILKREGTNEARLWENQTLIAGPKSTQVTERVEQELGVTYELFVRAVYSEQNQIDYFLKLNPGERKKKFDELLDLQKYETVRGNIVQVVNQFKKSRENYKQNLSQFEAVLQNQDLNELQSKVTRQMNFIKEKKWLQEKNSRQLELAEKNLSELEEKLKKANELKESIQKKKNSVELFSLQISDFEQKHPDLAGVERSELISLQDQKNKQIIELKERQELFQKTEQQFQNAVQQHSFLSKNLETIQSGIGARSVSSLKEYYQSVSQKLLDNFKELEKMETKKQEFVSQIRVLEQKIKDFSFDSENLQALHADCPMCRQKISEQHKKELLEKIEESRSKTEREKTVLKEESASLSKQITGRINEKTSLEKEKRELERKLTKAEGLEKIQKELAEKAEQKEEFQNKLASLGEKVAVEDIEKVQKSIQIVQQALETEKQKAVVSRLKIELLQSEKTFSNQNISQEAVLEAGKEFSKLQAQLESNSKEIQMGSEILSELKARVENIGKIKKQQDEIKQQLERASFIEQSLSVFSTALRETQQQLREGVIEAINMALAELWPNLYPYRDFSLAKLHIQDSDYMLMLKERNGDWVSAESMLSGGERSVAALALRMAIAFVLTRHLSWIILDEPTHNLDEKSVKKLSEVLGNRLPELVDQVFVITHDQEIASSATGTLYSLEREKDDDGCTVPVKRDIDRGTSVQ